MKEKGVIPLVLVLALLVVGLAGAALTRVRPADGSGGSAQARPGPDFTVALSRTPGGIAATVIVTNPGSEDLSDFRITRADVAALTGGTPLPLTVGKLSRGARTSLVLPYAGAVPAANAPVQLMLQ